jgi:hypothetical protein
MQIGNFLPIFINLIITCSSIELDNYFSQSCIFDDKENLKSSFRVEDVETGPCTIAIENEPISEEEFLEKYAYKLPVVFRRPKNNNNRNSLFQQKCQLDNLASEYGNNFVTISTANTYSYKKYTMRLRDYLKEYVVGFEKRRDGLVESKLKYGNETWYFFGENNYSEWKSLFDLYERPKYNLPGHEHAYSFGVAGFYTGVSLPVRYPCYI